MNTKKYLRRIFNEVLAEIDKSPDFADRISMALDLNSDSSTEPKRRGRRPPAVLDPFGILQNADESELRKELTKLDIEQLKDVVAQYAMDPSKLAMKWKDSSRIVEHIIAHALIRSKKSFLNFTRMFIRKDRHGLLKLKMPMQAMA